MYSTRPAKRPFNGGGNKRKYCFGTPIAEGVDEAVVHTGASGSARRKRAGGPREYSRSRWGRRRPWVVIASPILMLGQCHNPDLNSAHQRHSCQKENFA